MIYVFPGVGVIPSMGYIGMVQGMPKPMFDCAGQVEI